MKIDVPIDKTVFFTERLIDMGWEIISWAELLYSQKTIKGGKIIGLFQKGVVNNLLGIAYKGGKLVDTMGEYEKDEDGGYQRRLGVLRDKIDYVMKDVYCRKKTVVGSSNTRRWVKRSVKCKLVYSTRMNRWKNLGIKVFNEGRLWITPTDKEGKIGYIVDFKGIMYYSNHRSVDDLKKAESLLREYCREWDLEDLKISPSGMVTYPAHEIIKQEIQYYGK